MTAPKSRTVIGVAPSAPTRHLLALLARWPRRTLSRWLFRDDGVLAKLRRQALPSEIEPRPIRQTRFLAPTAALGVSVVGITDENYPPLLSQIPDPPLVLFYRGSIEALHRSCIAVVGARRCSSNGRAMAQRMGMDLATQGVCLVSGLALGIDTAAHIGVLDRGGLTVAVLGCGLDQIYPRSNAKLAQRVIDQGGALISEYPIQTPPLAHHFPERNRLISGAAAAVVLIEAGDKSGSLITARMALEQGREVFAVPGPAMSDVSRGCHRLIQQGAGLVVCAQEVLDELPGFTTTARLADAVAVDVSPQHHLSSIAISVLEHLDGYGQCLDEIASAVKQQPHEVSLAMVELELAGFVRLGGEGYIRAF